MDYWKTIRKHITGLDLKRELGEEEFMKMRPSINLPSLGKLYCNYEYHGKVLKEVPYVRSKKSKTDI